MINGVYRLQERDTPASNRIYR